MRGPGGGIDAAAGRDARQNDSSDLPAPELEVELRAIERVGLALDEQEIARLRCQLGDKSYSSVDT
jgi:hypothetical protein